MIVFVLITGGENRKPHVSSKTVTSFPRHPNMQFPKNTRMLFLHSSNQPLYDVSALYFHTCSALWKEGDEKKGDEKNQNTVNGILGKCVKDLKCEPTETEIVNPVKKIDKEVDADDRSAWLDEETMKYWENPTMKRNQDNSSSERNDENGDVNIEADRQQQNENTDAGFTDEETMKFWESDYYAVHNQMPKQTVINCSDVVNLSTKKNEERGNYNFIDHQDVNGSKQNWSKYNPDIDSVLSHVDSEGRAAMVDVSAKASTARTATARGYVTLPKDAFRLVAENKLQKGDVLTVAQIAGIMAAKRTWDLIPLCHPLPISNVDVQMGLENASSQVIITATVSCSGKTGVEMEALTAVCVSALTVYDMCKAVTHNIVIHDIKLISKTGGTRDYYS